MAPGGVRGRGDGCGRVHGPGPCRGLLDGRAGGAWEASDSAGRARVSVENAAVSPGSLRSVDVLLCACRGLCAHAGARQPVLTDVLESQNHAEVRRPYWQIPSSRPMCSSSPERPAFLASPRTRPHTRQVLTRMPEDQTPGRIPWIPWPNGAARSRPTFQETPGPGEPTEDTARPCWRQAGASDRSRVGILPISTKGGQRPGTSRRRSIPSSTICGPEGAGASGLARKRRRDDDLRTWGRGALSAPARRPGRPRRQARG